MKKIAIIGASLGEAALYKKAKELGLEIHAFAWEKGAICKDLADYFYPISIMETDKIISILKEIGVDGVVSNTSDITAQVTSHITTELGLVGNDYQAVVQAQNKAYVREKTKSIELLSTPVVFELEDFTPSLLSYPYVIKPKTGSGKQGVNCINNLKDYNDKLSIVENRSDYIVEQFIYGNEISVESLSYKGEHQIIQFTDKISTGGPHFVELEHHQPLEISSELKLRITSIVKEILTTINIENGAAHTELKIFDNNIYLVEVNVRGPGCYVSTDLIYLSTNHDYMKSIIEIALGDFEFPDNINMNYSRAGVRFLCSQNEERLPEFQNMEKIPGFIRGEWYKTEITEATGNRDRTAYYIYNLKK